MDKKDLDTDALRKLFNDLLATAMAPIHRVLLLASSAIPVWYAGEINNLNIK
jgi:hypothetical protein